MLSNMLHGSESFSTFITLIGFISYVSSLMYLQDLIYSWKFSHIQYICRVSPLCGFSDVFWGVTWRWKLSTFITFVGFLPCMNPLMSSDVWHGEGFYTFIRIIGFRPCDFSHVFQGLLYIWKFSHLQYTDRVCPLCEFSDMRHRGESFPTFITFIGFLPCESSLIYRKASLLHVSFTKPITFIKELSDIHSFSCVSCLMLSEA